MVIALLQFDLLIHDAVSIKDKRRVVSSVKARLHREHLAAVAEVGGLDTLNAARMALVILGSDGRHLAQSLDSIVAKLRRIVAPDAELGDTHRQLIRGDQLEQMAESTANDPSLDLALERGLVSRGQQALDELTAPSLRPEA